MKSCIAGERPLRLPSQGLSGQLERGRRVSGGGGPSDSTCRLERLREPLTETTARP
jgi:hypothetical protein